MSKRMNCGGCLPRKGNEMGKGECAVGCRIPGCQGCFVEPTGRRAALERENAELRTKIDNSRASFLEEREAKLVALRKLAAVGAGVQDVWYWQADGNMAETLSCPVVMRADTLCEMVARAERAEAALAITREEHVSCVNLASLSALAREAGELDALGLDLLIALCGDKSWNKETDAAVVVFQRALYAMRERLDALKDGGR